MIHNILHPPQKNRQTLQITLSHGQLLFLQNLAEEMRVTVSWILRSLLRQHLAAYLADLPTRPLRILGPTTRFNLVFHRLADKDYHCSLVHRRNRPMAAVIRMLVADLMLGRIRVSAGLLDAKEFQTWDAEAEVIEKSETCCVIQQHAQCLPVPKPDYWPKNPSGYLTLMILGRQNRRFPLQTPL